MSAFNYFKNINYLLDKRNRVKFCFINDYLEYTNLNEEQFFEIVDKFRPDHLWGKKR